MNKNLGRSLNTKTIRANSDKHAHLAEQTSRRSRLAKKAIEAICHSRPPVETPVMPINETQPPSPIDAQKQTESKLHKNEQAMIKIQRQINVLTEKIIRIKDETAERVAQVKSKLEQKTTEHADAVTRIRTEVAETMSEERKSHQQQIAELITEVKTTAAQEWKQLRSYQKKKIDEHRILLEQLAVQVDTNCRLQGESETELKSIQEHIAKLDERLQAVADAFREAAEAEATRSAICECCGRDGITKNMLVKIDSGQSICPTCLQALRGPRS